MLSLLATICPQVRHQCATSQPGTTYACAGCWYGVPLPRQKEFAPCSSPAVLAKPSLFNRPGELIEVAVLGVKRNQVRLGTGAPQHLPMVREELLERVFEED